MSPAVTILPSSDPKDLHVNSIVQSGQPRSSTTSSEQFGQLSWK